GHAGQANAVEDLPVAFARRIVGHAFSLEEERRPRIHSRRNRRLRRQRQAVANGAVLLVKRGAVQVAAFGRLKRDILRHVFRDARIQSLVREESFKGHVRVGGGNRSTAAGEIEISPEGHDEETEEHSNDEFQWLVLTLLNFSTLTPSICILSLTGTRFSG